jgi:hypothetical protein
MRVIDWSVKVVVQTNTEIEVMTDKKGTGQLIVEIK